ncbi:hypothetical protein WICPIJ_007323 [Wickerhamomyces pijperi]|uniref:Uncharacterized protein n=1 Tax=Wickerhamomyces pijperi TaxID=599730 RepID=A0A9P8TK23_WICPI|nr:hypothetical protein WICPIJ_007323 [Wickerhamomyces pijperi]
MIENNNPPLSKALGRNKIPVPMNAFNIMKKALAVEVVPLASYLVGIAETPAPPAPFNKAVRSVGTTYRALSSESSLLSKAKSSSKSSPAKCP